MRKLLLLILIVFFSLPVLAQERWGGGVDYERIHFGFSFHYVASSFKVFKNQDWQNPYPDADLGWLDQINTPLTHGVGLGILTDVRLGENANLRFNPSILFAGKTLNYLYNDQVDDPLLRKDVKATLLEMPLTFKFKSDRRENYAIYLLGGGKYSHNVAFKKRMDDRDELPRNKQIKLRPGFLSYEVGLGVDIYFEYFKMSPEIKWTQSIGNVMDKSEMNAFNTPIDKMFLRSIQFSLIFE